MSDFLGDPIPWLWRAEIIAPQEGKENKPLLLNILKGYALHLPHWDGRHGEDRWLVVLLILHCPLVVSPAGRRLALTADTLWGLCCTSHIWSPNLDIPVFSQHLHCSCSFYKFWVHSHLFDTLQECWKIKLGCRRIWECKKTPTQHPLNTCIDPWSQNSSEDISTWHTTCSVHSQLSGGCAYRGRQSGTTEMSYLSKPLCGKWIWIYSWSHLTESLPSSLPLNVFSVGEWWQWGVGSQIQIGDCSLGFNPIYEGNQVPHKGSHQPNNYPHIVCIFCS